MNMDLATAQVKDIADNLESLERIMLNMPQVECPVAHYFGPGVYIREVFLPAGAIVIGHEQKSEHLNFMVSGAVAMLTENGIKTLEAPQIFVGNPGRKVGYVLRDVTWQNIYPNENNERDIDALEARWLNKSITSLDHMALLAATESALADADRADFAEVIAAAGFTPEQVREQSEDISDLVSFPDNVAATVTVRESPIEGKGIFLSAPVEPGAIIGPALIGGKRTPLVRFTNHSATPNAILVQTVGGDVYVIASRRISGCVGGSQGEEVTIDYRKSLALGINVPGRGQK